MQAIGITSVQYCLVPVTGLVFARDSSRCRYRGNWSLVTAPLTGAVIYTGVHISVKLTLYPSYGIMYEYIAG